MEVVVAQDCECIEGHCAVHFRWMKCMACELCLHKTEKWLKKVTKKETQQGLAWGEGVLAHEDGRGGAVSLFYGG